MRARGKDGGDGGRRNERGRDGGGDKGNKARQPEHKSAGTGAAGGAATDRPGSGKWRNDGKRGQDGASKKDGNDRDRCSLNVKVLGSEQGMLVQVAKTLSIAGLKGLLLREWEEQQAKVDGGTGPTGHAAPRSSWADAQRMRLSLGGKQLEDDKNMQDYFLGVASVVHAQTIHMVLPVPMDDGKQEAQVEADIAAMTLDSRAHDEEEGFVAGAGGGTDKTVPSCSDGAAGAAAGKGKNGGGMNGRGRQTTVEAGAVAF